MSFITLTSHDRGEPLIYSGTRGNIRNITEKQDEGYLPMKWVGVVDFPFSLVMDTVLLPVTVPWAVYHAVYASGSLPEAHKSMVFSARFAQNGSDVVSVDREGNLKIWDRQRGTVRTFSAPGIMLTSVVPTGSGYVCGSSNQSALVMFDLDGNMSMLESRGGVVAGGIHNGRILMNMNGKTGLFDSGKFRPLERPAGRNIYELAVGPDGFMAGGASDGFVVIWDSSGKIIKSFRAHDGAIRGLAVGPGGRLITGSQAGDKIARVWSKNGELLRELRGHDDDVYAVAISPDGKYIVTGSRDSTLRLWTADGSLMQKMGGWFSGHSDYITSVDFSPDSGSILSSSADRSVRVWDLQGRQAAVLR